MAILVAYLEPGARKVVEVQYHDARMDMVREDMAAAIARGSKVKLLGRVIFDAPCVQKFWKKQYGMVLS